MSQHLVDEHLVGEGLVGTSLDELRMHTEILAIRGDAATRVSGLHHDSREVEPGDLFVARRGEASDGSRYAEAAIARGAVAVLSDHELALDAPLVLVPDVRRAMPALAEALAGFPSRQLRGIGVTGTNGKTTTTWLIDEALRAVGAAPALLGTIEERGPGGYRRASTFTTPEADHISRFLRQMVDRGATHLVMEVSSHALVQHRADALTFDTAIFTNLTQDHLDYHHTMEAYFEAKARLFLELAPRTSIVCVDGAWGRRLADRIHERIKDDPSRLLLRVSRDPGSSADLRPLHWEGSREGIRGEITSPWGQLSVRSRLVGAHNLDNLLFTIAALASAGTPLGIIQDTLELLRGAPGRLERVDATSDVSVVVDYSHTPDALVQSLAALRPLTPGRLIAVFGCGGDRDHGKRPLMGEAAARGADLVLVTSDNPRTEDPRKIVDEILPGVRRHLADDVPASELGARSRAWSVEVDRRAAIDLAVRAARPGDTVLIAGKGHEDYQIVGTEKTHLDDREEARAALARHHHGGARS